MDNAKRRRGRPRKSATLDIDEFFAVLELLVENAKRHRMLESILVTDGKLKVTFCVPLFGVTERLLLSKRDKSAESQSPEQLRMQL
jgi:hypothetical protein